MTFFFPCCMCLMAGETISATDKMSPFCAIFALGTVFDDMLQRKSEETQNFKNITSYEH